MPEAKPIWSDDRIGSYSGNARTAWEARRLFDAMTRVRDDYETAIAELRAEIAALRAPAAGYPLGAATPQEWEPVEDTYLYGYPDEARILAYRDGELRYIEGANTDWPRETIIPLPDDVRLYSHRPQAQE